MGNRGKQKPRTAAIYIRISKDRPNETSTETQEALAREYAERKGWAVVGVEPDEGRSAYKQDVRRPGFEKVMALVESGAADVLIVWRLDRFARSITGFWSDWQRIRDAGGELVSVTEDLDTTKSIGRMMVGMIAGFAELESEAKSERILAWHDGRRRRGDVPTGPRPFGYNRIKATKTTPGTLEVDTDEADVIRSAADAVLDDTPLMAIAADLNDRGLVTGRGAQWTARTVRRILTSPTTAGLRDDDGVLLEGCWGPILDRGTWDRVREIVLDPARFTGKTLGRRWMLTGIATCGRCGTTMRTKGHAAGIRYACRECGLSIPTDRVDDLVSAAITESIDRSAWDRVRADARSNGMDAAALEAQRDELTARYRSGEIDATEFVRLDDEIERAARAAADPIELPEVDDLAESWSELTVDQRRLVLNAVFDAVTVAPAVQGTFYRFDPDRVEITWAM